LSPLKETKNITRLGINRIDNIDYNKIAELTNITALNIAFTQTTDILFLQELLKLRQLYLHGTYVYDIAPLLSISSLSYVTLSDACLDLNDPSVKNVIDTLKARGVNVSTGRKQKTVSQCGRECNYNYININHRQCGNYGKNIEYCENRQKKSEVDICFDPQLLACIQDNYPNVNFWVQRNDIKALNCSGYGIYSVRELENFPNLEYLDVSDNLISRAGALSSLKKLKTLIADDNCIDDTQFVEAMSSQLEVSFGQQNEEKKCFEGENVVVVDCRPDPDKPSFGTVDVAPYDSTVSIKKDLIDGNFINIEAPADICKWECDENYIYIGGICQYNADGYQESYKRAVSREYCSKFRSCNDVKLGQGPDARIECSSVSIVQCDVEGGELYVAPRMTECRACIESLSCNQFQDLHYHCPECETSAMCVDDACTDGARKVMDCNKKGFKQLFTCVDSEWKQTEGCKEYCNNKNSMRYTSCRDIKTNDDIFELQPEKCVMDSDNQISVVDPENPKRLTGEVVGEWIAQPECVPYECNHGEQCHKVQSFQKNTNDTIKIDSYFEHVTVEKAGYIKPGEWHHYGPFYSLGNIKVEMTGDGDADLYVQDGSMPAFNNYKCRPYEGNSIESCSYSKAGHYFIAVTAFKASTYEVKISYDKRVVNDDANVKNMLFRKSGTIKKDEWIHYGPFSTMVDDYFYASLTIKNGETAGSQDADIFINRGTQASFGNKKSLCKVQSTSDNEICVVEGSGDYFVSIYGTTDANYEIGVMYYVNAEQERYVSELERIPGDITLLDSLIDLEWHKKWVRYEKPDSNPENVDASIVEYFGDERTMTFDEALNYCEDLNHGDKDDWRLSTVHELRTILSYDHHGPAVFDFYSDIFNSQYWSITTIGSSAAYVVQMESGNISKSLQTHENLVSCVRGGTIPTHHEKPRYFSAVKNDGNSVVVDRLTKLMWQDKSKMDKSHKQGFEYCDNLYYGEYTDWRLPTIEELSSILDYTTAVSYDFIDHDVDYVFSRFPELNYSLYLSNTESSINSEQVWYVDFTNGVVGKAQKRNTKMDVKCVRDYN